MKTTPIYILLIIFFLNFDLAWGLDDEDSDCRITLKPKPHYLQTLYSVINTNNEIFHSINIGYYLNSDDFIKVNMQETIFPIHRIRLNIGLSKVLAEVDYDLGIYITNPGTLHIMPYVTLGTNIYSFGYGGGLDIVIPTRSRFAIVGNLNYRATEKLFGHTDAQQWYQSGFGAKLGITTSIR